MTALLIFTRLKYFLPAHSWSWVLLALRQDDLVWQALQPPALLERALQSLPPVPEAWRPAELALLALGVSADMRAGDLRGAFWQCFPQELDSMYAALNVSPEYVAGASAPATLAQAGLEALAWRQRCCPRVAWQGMPPGFQPANSQRSILACLYGMLPDPLALLHDLAAWPGQEMLGARLALHALFSNPLPPGEQLRIVQQLFDSLEAPARQFVLNELSAQRSDLAQQLAREELESLRQQNAAQPENMLEAKSTEAVFTALEFGGGRSLAFLARRYQEMLTQWVETAQLCLAAAQPARAARMLARALRLERRLQGHLSAYLAQAAEQARRGGVNGEPEVAFDAGLEAWRQAVSLAPEADLYRAGLAAALADCGRHGEARACLEAGVGNGAPASQAAVWLRRALAANRLEPARLHPDGAARRAALTALEVDAAQPGLAPDEYLALANFFLEAGLPAQADQAAYAGIRCFPADAGLHTFLALPADGPALERLEHAALALASPGGEKNELLRRRLVANLEALESWASVLQEQQALVDSLTAPGVEDWRLLARAALRAGEPGKALVVCQRLLQSAPKDELALRLAAQAGQAMGDWPSTAQYLQSATVLAPQDASLWVDLAQVYQAGGQMQRAVEALETARLALPEVAQVHLALGEAYLTQGALTQAVVCLYRAQELGPTPQGALLLGQALLRLGRFEEANQVLAYAYRQQCAGLSPEGAAGVEDAALQPYAYAYAQSWLKLGNLAQATPLLELALRLQPQDNRVGLDLARVWLDTAASDSAPHLCQSALDVLKEIEGRLDGQPPEHLSLVVGAGLPPAEEHLMCAELHALLAEAFTAVGNLSPALEHYHRVFEMPANQYLPDRERLALGFGRAALGLGRLQTALAVVQDVAQALPHSLALQRLLSEIYLANNLPQEAFQSARSVLNLASAQPGGESLEILVWFIEQGLRIASTPGGEPDVVRSEVIRALEYVTHLAPSRIDLLARLGWMLWEDGSQDAAREVLRRLAKAGDDLGGLSLDELVFTGKTLRSLGETGLALDVLRRAEGALAANVDAAPSPAGQSALYVELAYASQQAGEYVAGLYSLERALALDASRFDLHKLRAELCEQAGQPAGALESLKAALRLRPQETGLHLEIANRLSQVGEWQEALLHAEHVLSASALSPEVLHQARLLAAELSCLLLHPQQAWAWVHADLAEMERPCQHVDHLCLRAEMALESGDLSLAAENLARLPENLLAARPLADRARLAGRLGEPKAEALFQALVQALADVSFEKPAAALRSAGLAALELHHWQPAQEWACRWVQVSPGEPWAHLHLARTWVVCAEAQSLCQSLQVVGHAPGVAALSEDARLAFQQEIDQAAALVEAPLAERSQPVNSSAAAAEVALWRARGLAAFEPTQAHAAALGRALHARALRSCLPRPEEVAALMLAFQRAGMPDEALKAVSLLKGASRGKSWVEAGSSDAPPVVLIQEILALAATGRLDDFEKCRVWVEKALDVASQALPGGWPPAPVLYFLAAWLASRQAAAGRAAALQAIQQALLAWPDEAHWHALAAELYQQADEYAPIDLAPALQHLEQAARLEPGCAGHFIRLGRALQIAGDLVSAGRALQQAVHLMPPKSEEAGQTWLELAQVQRLQGDLELAAQCAEQALECAPNALPALLLRGAIALQAGSPRGALSRAQTALRLQQENIPALRLLAQALQALDRHEDALAALEKALPLLENPLEILVERARLIHLARGAENGLAALQELAAANPGRPDLQALLAEWLFEAGQLEVGVQAAQVVLRSAGDGLPSVQRVGLHYRVGLHLRRSGQLDQALYHFHEALRLAPDHLEACLELGRTYQEQRAHSQALKAYKQAMEIAPLDYRPCYQAGLALKEARDYLQAEEMLRQAAELAPDEVSIHRLLGAVVALNLVHSGSKKLGVKRT